VEGQSVTISGAGYRPGTVVTVVLSSSGATLGTAVADTKGTFTLIAALPAGTTGSQTVRVLGESIDNRPSTITTTIDIAPASGSGLAFTGNNSLALAIVGAVLLLTGMAATRRARTRRS
jgi:hypothetical protein